MTPVLFQDAVKSGHFPKALSHDLLYLVAKVDSYNLRFNRFLGTVHNGYVVSPAEAEAFHDNWSVELTHIAEQKEQILILCRKILRELD
jgi:hypothetical protein